MFEIIYANQKLKYVFFTTKDITKSPKGLKNYPFNIIFQMSDIKVCQ